MTPRANPGALTAAGLLVLAGACGPPLGGPDEIEKGGGNSSAAKQVTITVTNGWTQVPVAGATVSSNIASGLTDAAGRVTLTYVGTCPPVRVVAAGFLDRQTCGGDSITLWPASDEVEADAIRRSVFYNDLLFPNPTGTPIQLMLSEPLARRADVVDAWAAAATTIQQLSGGRVSFEFHRNPDREVHILIMEAGSAATCDPAATWSIDAAGFCGQRSTSWSEPDRIHVQADRVADSQVATRGLLSETWVFRPHPLPGLMNNRQPDRDFSEFERRTLHMIGLRRFRSVAWPDYDR